MCSTNKISSECPEGSENQHVINYKAHKYINTPNKSNKHIIHPPDNLYQLTRPRLRLKMNGVCLHVCVCVTTPTTKEIWRHKNNILASRTFLAIRLDCPVSPNARPGFFSQCSGNSKLPHSLNSSLRKNPTANNQGLNTMTGTQRQVNSPGINRDYFSFHPIFILSILNSWPPGQRK